MGTTVGELIAEVYPRMLKLYGGDEKMAAVMTAKIVNELLAAQDAQQKLAATKAAA